MKPTAVVADVTHPTMFRLQWPDGVLSADMYNRTRAADILRNYEGYIDIAVKRERMRGNTFKSGFGRQPRPPMRQTGAEPPR